MVIRDPLPADEADWRRLWTGYTTFYEADVPEDVTAETWRRIIARDTTVFGRVACEDSQVIGFTNSVLHPGTWSKEPICYLEDLFVDPAMRGRRIADVLIEALAAIGREKGWGVIRWITADDNYRGRGVYDRLATRTMWITYDKTL